MTNPNWTEQERLPFLEGWRTPTTQIDGRLIAGDVLQLALVTPEKRSDYGARFDGNNGTLPKDYHGGAGNGGGVGGGFPNSGHGGHAGFFGVGHPGKDQMKKVKKSIKRGLYRSRRDEMDDMEE